jgi:hypothetical protein
MPCILNTVWMMQELVSSEQQQSETSVFELLPSHTGFKIQLSSHYYLTLSHSYIQFLHSSKVCFNGVWPGIPFSKVPKPAHLITGAGSKRQNF